MANNGVGAGGSQRDDNFMESRLSAAFAHGINRTSAAQRRILRRMAGDDRAYIRRLANGRQQSTDLYLRDIGQPVPIRLMTALSLYKGGYVAPRRGGAWNPAYTTELILTSAGRREGQKQLKQTT